MKVVKIAAIVIGAAALIATGVGVAAGMSIASAFTYATAGVEVATGLGFSTIAAVELGALAIDASMLSGAIMPKPSQGGEQTKWKADPYAGIPYVMGRTLTSGNVVYRRGHGDNDEYNTFVTILGLGPFHSIDTTFMDKTTVGFSGGNATGTYAGQIYQATQLGACPEAAALSPPVGSPPGWTSAHKLSGLCAAMNAFKYDAKSKNGLTVIPQPSWIVHAGLVYDPRLDDTYPGGSGACRAYDESTYVWSEDPHLHGLTWALGRYQNGVRVAGIGLGNTVAGSVVSGIDVASFVEGANLNDARGWTIGGQVYTRPDTQWGSLKAMLQAGGAKPVLVGGRISCVNRAPRVSLATIRGSDIVGKASLAGTQPRRSRINTIVPQYRSEAHDWQVVSASAVSVADFVTLDGDERTRELPYPLVQDVDQVAQIATYDIYDLREAGPGTVPLGPWWLNYRIGDCVTFEPEDGFSLKTLIEGRAIDAQAATVTYTLRGETDGKHAYALGQTGTAPPIASFTYDNTVAAPDAGDWILVGAALTDNGTSIPALVITGVSGNPSAEAVVFDYRVHVDGAGDEDNWNASAVESPTVTRKEFTSVTPRTQYEVSVRYRVRGTLGERLILGPVTAGDLAIGVRRLVTKSINYPLSSDDTGVSIAAFDGVTDNGLSISFPADSLTGLTSDTNYALLWDIAGSAYLAVASPASAEMANPEYVFIGWQMTSSGGVYADPDPPPPGYCVADDTPILLADGSTAPASSLAIGTVLRTKHERTLAWGDYAVAAIDFVDAEVFACALTDMDGNAVTVRATADHLFLIANRWVRAADFGAPDGTARVAKITVAEAHTYVSAGVLSHNIKPLTPI